MTESEDTQGGSSSSSASSGAPSGAAKKPRRRATTGARRKTAATSGAKTTRKKAGTGTRRKSRRRRTSSRTVRLQDILNDLAKRANVAGTTIADLSEKGAEAARGTIVKVSASSKQTIVRVRKEWDKLDNTRKAQFVAGLLGALAATAAGVAKSRSK